MSEMVERVARAIEQANTDSTGLMFRELLEAMARAAIEAMPLEQLIQDAYVRGVNWSNENPTDQYYRFKAAADYADKTLSAALSHGGDPIGCIARAILAERERCAQIADNLAAENREESKTQADKRDYHTANYWNACASGCEEVATAIRQTRQETE